MSMSVEHLRTGDRAIVRFRFIKSPEYLRIGMKLVFREGRTKAIGSISQLFPHIPPQASSTTRIKTRQQGSNVTATTSTTTTTAPVPAVTTITTSDAPSGQATGQKESNEEPSRATT